LIGMERMVEPVRRKDTATDVAVERPVGTAAVQQRQRRIDAHIAHHLGFVGLAVEQFQHQKARGTGGVFQVVETHGAVSGRAVRPGVGGPIDAAPLTIPEGQHALARGVVVLFQFDDGRVVALVAGLAGT